MEISDDYLGKLYQIGCAAPSYQMHEQAHRILAGVYHMADQNLAAIIGLASIKLASGDFAKTADFIESSGLRLFPDDASLRCMLGAAKLRSGDRMQGRKLLEEAARDGDEGDKALARHYLEGDQYAAY